MKKMLYWTMAGLFLAGLLAGCAKAGNEGEAKADLEKIKAIYIGYYDTLEAGKGNPAGGLGAGLQYVESKKGELREIARRLNGNSAAMSLLETFQNELVEISQQRGRQLSAYASYKSDIESQMQTLANAMGGE